MNELPIIDLPPDPAKRAGLEAFRRCQQHRQRVIVMRLHVGWQIRKYEPQRAEELLVQHLNRYTQRARSYMQNVPPMR